MASTTKDKKRKGDEPEKRDAFTELMQPKRQKQVIPGATTPSKINTMEQLRRKYTGRSSLGMYIEAPEAFPPFRSVIYYNDDFVAVRDIYPKSSVHLLLLPRSAAHNKKDPVVALNSDGEFLEKVRAEAAVLKKYVASELRRMYGEGSAAEGERTKALCSSFEEEGGVAAVAAADGEEPPPLLPKGRDWEAGIKVGVHATPSMSHVHIHVMSPDNVGGSMKKAKHYLSFNTGFLVGLDDFPLKKSDPRRNGGGEFLGQNLKCWRCDEEFGTGEKGFRQLKTHLQGEFEEWKRE